MNSLLKLKMHVKAGQLHIARLMSVISRQSKWRKIIIFSGVPVCAGILTCFLLAGANNSENTHRKSDQTAPTSTLGAVQEPTADSGQATAGNSGNQNDSSKPSQTSTSSQPSNVSRPESLQKIRAAKPLLFSKSNITIDILSNVGSTTFEVFNESNTPIFLPIVSGPKGLDIRVVQPPAGLGLEKNTKRWEVFVQSNDINKSGQGYITVTALGVTGGNHEGKIFVQWQAIPHFSAIQGAIGRTEDAASVTYTVNFTLAPSQNFGTPTMHMKLSTPQPCIGGETTKVVRYDGQNTHSLSCTVARPTPFVPGTGALPPPAPDTHIGFTVDIYGIDTASGKYIVGAQLKYITLAP